MLDTCRTSRYVKLVRVPLALWPSEKALGDRSRGQFTTVSEVKSTSSSVSAIPWR